MTKLALHQTTIAHITRVLAHPPHALLITGLKGMGKTSVAQEISAQLLEIDLTSLDKSAQFMDATPAENEPYGIDIVRKIRHFMTLKGGHQPHDKISRIVLLPDAGMMTKDAQNALLKLLEEPSAGSMFILTATSERALLPTIVSRCQVLALVKPEHDALVKYFEASGRALVDIDLALLISNDLPGLAASMLDTAQEHPLAKAAVTARSIVQQTAFERLCLVESLAKERQHCLDLCAILQQMAHLALQKSTSKSADRWQRILNSAYDCQLALETRVNTKLAMTRLMLSL